MNAFLMLNAQAAERLQKIYNLETFLWYSFFILEKNLEIHDGYYLVKPVEESTEYFSGELIKDG